MSEVGCWRLSNGELTPVPELVWARGRGALRKSRKIRVPPTPHNKHPLNLAYMVPGAEEAQHSGSTTEMRELEAAGLDRECKADVAGRNRRRRPEGPR